MSQAISTPAIHYFTVDGRVIERHNLRADDASLSQADARCFAIGVARESAKYAAVGINWTIEDADDGDGWILVSSQMGTVIGKRHVRYHGIVDPRERSATRKYTEHSRHDRNADAYAAVAALKAEGRDAYVAFDAYASAAGRPAEVVKVAD